MILRNFILLQVFTIYMENSLVWNLHWSEFQFAWTPVDANNEVTLHRSEISNRFEFISSIM